MEGRTQLIIDGVEVVLPERFATTVKRENSFFTKNGEYTYDCTLRLDNQTNQSLYGWLHRLNKKEAVRSKRWAVLMADGRVYCRGTEVITGWTEDEVTVQVVAGNSELNYVVSDSLKIEWLDMGEIGDMGEADVAWPMRYNLTQQLAYPALHYCLPTIYNSAENVYVNNYLCRGLFGESRPKIIVGSDNPNYVSAGRGDLEVIAQPYLCALVTRLLRALGYTIGVNHLDESQYRYLFVVNLRNTKKYAEMLAGWTVKDFLLEVEKLTGVVLLVDNVKKTVDLIMKSQYYSQARILPIRDVTDSYELTVEEDGDEDWSTSDIGYALPDDADHRLLRLPETLKKNTPTVEGDWPFDGRVVGNPYSRQELLKDTSTGRLFVRIPTVKDTDFLNYTKTGSQGNLTTTMPPRCTDWDANRPSPYYPNVTDAYFFGKAKGSPAATEFGKSRREVDQLCNLEREESVGEMELKIRPAVLKLMPSYRYYLRWAEVDNDYVLGAGLTNIVVTGSVMATNSESQEEGSQSTTEEATNFVDVIGGYTEQADASAGDLLVAFYAGLQLHRHGYLPQAHIDAWHAQNVDEFWHEKEDTFPELGDEIRAFEGSLRLKDIDAEVFAGVYRVDTTRRVTFTTFDPNVIDPRSILVVRNRRWVVRDIEETLTSKGRKPSLKVTCHPIEITDTAAESRWVLTKSVWDDGGAWIDSGKWND